MVDVEKLLDFFWARLIKPLGKNGNTLHILTALLIIWSLLYYLTKEYIHERLISAPINR